MAALLMMIPRAKNQLFMRIAIGILLLDRSDSTHIMLFVVYDNHIVLKHLNVKTYLYVSVTIISSLRVV
jgi:hypothetical protein